MRHTPRVSALLLLCSGCLPPTTYGLRSDGALGNPGDVSIGASGMVVVNNELEGGTPGGEVEAGYVMGPGVGVTAAIGSVSGVGHGQADLRLGSEDPDARVAGHVLLGAGALFSGGGALGGAYGGGVLGFGLSEHDRLYVGGKVNPVGSGSADAMIWWMQPTVGFAHRWDGTDGSSITLGGELVALMPLAQQIDVPPLYAPQVWVTWRPPREDAGYSTAMDDEEPPEDL